MDDGCCSEVLEEAVLNRLTRACMIDSQCLGGVAVLSLDHALLGRWTGAVKLTVNGLTWLLRALILKSRRSDQV